MATTVLQLSRATRTLRAANAIVRTGERTARALAAIRVAKAAVVALGHCSFASYNEAADAAVTDATVLLHNK